MATAAFPSLSDRFPTGFPIGVRIGCSMMGDGGAVDQRRFGRAERRVTMLLHERKVTGASKMYGCVAFAGPPGCLIFSLSSGPTGARRRWLPR